MKKEAKKNTHGGAGRGQGRHPVADQPKVQKNFRFRKSTDEHLKSLAEESGHSQTDITEYAIQLLKSLPKNLKIT